MNTAVEEETGGGVWGVAEPEARWEIEKLEEISGSTESAPNKETGSGEQKSKTRRDKSKRERERKGERGKEGREGARGCPGAWEIERRRFALSRKSMVFGRVLVLATHNIWT